MMRTILLKNLTTDVGVDAEKGPEVQSKVGRRGKCRFLGLCGVALVRFQNNNSPKWLSQRCDFKMDMSTHAG